MDRLTDQHRKAQRALQLATVRDVLKLWPALDVTRLDRTYPAWETAVATLIQRNRATSAGLAAAYLRAFRAAHIGLEDFTPQIAGAAPAEQVSTVLRVTSVVAIKNSMQRGVPLEKAAQQAFVLTSGDASRLVLDAGRETIVDSVRADPEAGGWQRVTDGNACQFCQMLAGRGHVYSADTADFASHAHCGCSAVPVYGDARTVRSFTPSARRTSGPPVDNTERIAAFQQRMNEASASIRAARP